MKFAFYNEELQKQKSINDGICGKWFLGISTTKPNLAKNIFLKNNNNKSQLSYSVLSYKK